ncbi:hypothetical protein, partial [Actinoplanes philippinensis]|uniref:hypothetical protein n=1 Tax=Actinoplanes philippinensis TaxID=35752 RepID=UPI0033CB2014
MKRRSVLSLPAAAALAAPSLTDALAAAGFEGPSVVTGNLPVFHERLKDELTFPLAWPRAHDRDFRGWKRRARHQFESLLCEPADRTPFAPEIIDEQPGPGYRRRQIVLDLTRHSRVRATMLVPDGPGPFPAALLLHDHGAKFDIGKEKLIQPWYDETRLASAQAWAARYFSDRFPGDHLARNGYA